MDINCKLIPFSMRGQNKCSLVSLFFSYGRRAGCCGICFGIYVLEPAHVCSGCHNRLSPWGQFCKGINQNFPQSSEETLRKLIQKILKESENMPKVNHHSIGYIISEVNHFKKI